MTKLTASISSLLAGALASFGCVDVNVDELDTSESAIVGGAHEPDANHPWGVRVASGTCGGALIHPQWVLTAAHCAEVWPLGTATYARTNPVDGFKTSDKREIVKRFIHPGYVPGDFFSTDLALMKLDSPFAIDWSMQTLGLPQAPPVVGNEGTVANASHNEQLPDGEIAVYRAPVPPGAGTSPVFEITTKGFGLCQGDSGSAFAMLENGRRTAAGVASYSSQQDCKTIQEAVRGGFADVNRAFDWIQNTMGMTPDEIAGNTRLRWEGKDSNGTMMLLCDNPAGTMFGPMNVAGLNLGAACKPDSWGDIWQNVTCLGVTEASGYPTPREIIGFTMRTHWKSGAETIKHLPYGKSLAFYDDKLPDDAAWREFTCHVGLEGEALPVDGELGAK